MPKLSASVYSDYLICVQYYLKSQIEEIANADPKLDTSG